jgi:hypothetical protein
VVRRPTMVLSRSLRGSLFRAGRLRGFLHLVDGEEPNQPTSLAGDCC